jgi:hypothetical protein
MTTLIIRTNASQGTEVLIPDLGIIVPPTGGTVVLDDPDSTLEAAQSADLVKFCQDDAFGAGSSTLILNDGSVDILQSLIEDFLDTSFLRNAGPFSVAQRDDGGQLLIPALEVTYDNTTTGLAATDVQAALDLVASGAGSGIDESAHEELDTLVHNLAEANYAELRYDSQGRIIQTDYWADNTKVRRVRRARSYYLGTSNRIDRLETAQYDAAGDPLYCILSTYTYNGLRLLSSETTRGPCSPEYPTNTAPPQASAERFESGQEVSSSEGSWDLPLDSIAYQWYRGSIKIPGATESTYILTSLDIPELISCRVIASNAGGDSDAVFTNALSSIWRDALTILNADGATGYLWSITQGLSTGVEDAPVNSWQDVTGASTFVQPITAGQPLLSFDTIEDSFALLFDGVDDYMTNDALATYFQLNDTQTVMIWGTESYLSSAEVMIAASETAGSTTWTWIERARAGGPFDSGEIYSGIPLGDRSVPYWMESSPLGSNQYIGGVTQTGGVLNELGFSALIDNFTLGARRYLSSISGYLNNKVRAFAITDRLLTSTERDIIDALFVSQVTVEVFRFTTPQITGNPHRGETLTAIPGEYGNLTTLTGQWYADGVALSGETGTTLLMASGFDLQEITYVETAVGGSTTLTTTSNSLQFAPEQILTEYWEAGDLVGTVANDAGVSSWPGRNSVYTWTAPLTAQQPLFKEASVAGTFPHVKFDGIDDYMNANAMAAAIERDQPFEFLTVHQDLSISIDTYLWSSSSGDTTSWKGLHADNADDYILFFRSGNGSYVNNDRVTNVTSEPDWTYVSMNEPDTGTNSRSISLDLYTSQGGDTPVYNTSKTVNTNLTSQDRTLLGALDIGGLSRFADVGYRAVGFIDSILPALSRAQLFDYINAKWSFP